VIRSFLAGPAALVLSVCGVNCAGSQPVTVPVPVSCPATTWSGWGDVPPCDLDGSQTWILVGESDFWTVDPAGDCAGAGGVYSVSVTDPVTHYCIDVDY